MCKKNKRIVTLIKLIKNNNKNKNNNKKINLLF
jgi:hypothetical protein